LRGEKRRENHCGREQAAPAKAALNLNFDLRAIEVKSGAENSAPPPSDIGRSRWMAR
jgi:hypothetical protein